MDMTDRVAQATGQDGVSSGTALSAANGVRCPSHGDWCTHHPFVDASVPNVARIYDYLLGGKDNYSADRNAAVELVLQPHLETIDSALVMEPPGAGLVAATPA